MDRKIDRQTQTRRIEWSRCFKGLSGLGVSKVCPPWFETKADRPLALSLSHTYTHKCTHTQRNRHRDTDTDAGIDTET